MQDSSTVILEFKDLKDITVMVNMANVTYMVEEDTNTIIHFIGGESITVTQKIKNVNKDMLEMQLFQHE